MLQYKSQPLEKFTNCKRDVADANKLAVKKLRSDQGEEFTCAAFKEFCKGDGMRQEFTAWHSPHQNGMEDRPRALALEFYLLRNVRREFPAVAVGGGFPDTCYLASRLPT